MFDWKTKIKVFGLSSALLVALQFAACYFCNFVNIQNQANQETRLRSWSLINNLAINISHHSRNTNNILQVKSAAERMKERVAAVNTQSSRICIHILVLNHS